MFFFFRSLFNAPLADHLMASTFVSHPVTSRHTTLLRGLPASGVCWKHIMKWGGCHWRHLCKLLLPVFPFLLQAPTWFLTIPIQPTTCVYQCVSAPTHLPRRLWKDGTATPMARPEITDWIKCPRHALGVTEIRYWPTCHNLGDNQTNQISLHLL